VSIESFICALDHLLLMEMALYKLNTLLLLLPDLMEALLTPERREPLEREALSPTFSPPSFNFSNRSFNFRSARSTSALRRSSFRTACAAANLACLSFSSCARRIACLRASNAALRSISIDRNTDDDFERNEDEDEEVELRTLECLDPLLVTDSVVLTDGDVLTLYAGGIVLGADGVDLTLLAGGIDLDTDGVENEEDKKAWEV
jgi:hypothetical protein